MGKPMNRQHLACVMAVLTVCATSTIGLTGEADVVAVKTAKDGSGLWTFEVTIRHADAGWGHYANRFEILSPDGDILGTRVLHHPHVDEQPFTRSLRGISLPNGLKTIRIRAIDSVHSDGGKEITVDLSTQ